MQKSDNDCLRCCLSELLSIPYNEVSNIWEGIDFEKYKSGEVTFDFNERYNSFLKELNLSRIIIPINKSKKLNFAIFGNCKCLGVLQKKGRCYSHSCIVNITKVNKENISFNIEDPKENSEYSINDLVQLEFLIKNDKIN
jgi:hypothetical protein